MFCAFVYAFYYIPLQEDLLYFLKLIVVFLAVYIFVDLSVNFYRYLRKDIILQKFCNGFDSLSTALSSGSSEKLYGVVRMLEENDNPLIKSLMKERKSYLFCQIDIRYRDELKEKINKDFKDFERNYKEKINSFRDAHPLYRACLALDFSIEFLRKRRVEIDKEWKAAYQDFSWWNKIYYGDTPDFVELDKEIKSLEESKELLIESHDKDYESLGCYYEGLGNRAVERVEDATNKAMVFVEESKYGGATGSNVVKNALLLSLFSIPVSLWADFDRAGDVYDVLRSVNGNYENLSDVEIWWQTLLLPSESVAGLASLTKGAYLESLVARDSGGQLFEHFNHPETDIVIGGTAFQIKATDSEDYINSVTDGIPVIATSEVAGVTDALDSGYTNEELEGLVSLSVGGEVVDVGDAAVDAILTGVGGLGLFASLDGIKHAIERTENGGDPVESMFEGAGVAIKGTAKAAVDTLELGYNMLNSRPSRFIGRALLKSANALEKKVSSPTDKTV